MKSVWKRQTMSRGGLSAAILAIALFLSSGKPATAAMYIGSELQVQGYNTYGSDDLVCVCKTAACNQPGDFCYTCSYLTGSSFGVDPSDVSYCLFGCVCEVTRYGLRNWACCYNWGKRSWKLLFRQEAQVMST